MSIAAHADDRPVVPEKARVLECETDKHRSVLKELRVLFGNRLFSIDEFHNPHDIPAVVQDRHRENVVGPVF